jgi:hypothetical protein
LQRQLIVTVAYNEITAWSAAKAADSPQTTDFMDSFVVGSNVFRYWLLTLISVVTLAAVVFAVLPRDAAVIGELRQDLKIADHHPITILERTDSDGILAVVEQNNTFKLFVCYRDFWGSGHANVWEIPFVVGSGAPPGEPEAIWEYSQEFDHFPTGGEIARFRHEYGL